MLQVVVFCPLVCQVHDFHNVTSPSCSLSPKTTRTQNLSQLAVYLRLLDLISHATPHAVELLWVSLIDGSLKTGSAVGHGELCGACEEVCGQQTQEAIFTQVNRKHTQAPWLDVAVYGLPVPWRAYHDLVLRPE